MPNKIAAKFTNFRVSFTTTCRPLSLTGMQEPKYNKIIVINWLINKSHAWNLRKQPTALAHSPACQRTNCFELSL